MELTDKELVAHVLNGDKSKFDILMQRYYPLSIYYVRSKFNFPPETVKDICQNVFVKVFRKLDKYNVDKSFKTWVITICRNTGIDYTRTAEPSVPLNEAIYKSKATKIEDLVCKKIEINEAVKTLDKDLSEIIQLKYFWDFKCDEIAKIMKIPSGTVRGKLCKARKELNKIMNKGGGNNE